MTGTTSKRAALPMGGDVLLPPIAQDRASDVLGEPIPDTAWLAIGTAFAEYGQRLRALEASKVAKSKGDRQSWHTRQTAAVRAVEAAMDRLETARSRHGFFLEEASEAFSIAATRQSYGSEGNARHLLDQAYRQMLHAVTIMERAKPMEIETPTAAASRDMLAQDVAAALRGAGMKVRVSNGFDLGQLERVRLSDLTGFERLIGALGVGADKKPAAFSAWLRELRLTEESGGDAP